MADSQQIRILRRALDGFTAENVRRLVTVLVETLAGSPGQGGTPRDTQWASSNWIPQIGTPFDGTYGSKEDVSRERQNAGLQSLDLFKLALGNVWVTNNVPYIEELNNGSSRQAAAGFVQAAVVRAELLASRAR